MEVVSLKKAAFINFISKYSIVVIQLIYNGVLARILLPEEFGVVAILNVFISFFVLLADMGVGNAIIQNQDLEDDDVSSIFTLSVIISIIAAVIFSILSVPISIIYSNSEYMIMCPLLSISVLFNSLNTVPAALLMKYKKFKLVAIRQVIVNLVCSIITIIFAINGAGYYSLIAYTVFTAIINFLCNYYSCSFKFKLKLKLSSINKVKEFSTFLVGYNTINYLSKNIDKLVIGKLSGSADVGNYNKAHQLTSYPLNYLTFVITPVMLPMLSQHQHNKEYIYSKYLKLVKLLSLMGMYISIVGFFCAEEVTTIFYGPNWGNAAVCFKWMSLSIWAQMINSSSSSIFQIFNKTRLQFKSGIYMFILTLFAITIGYKFAKLEGIAICIMIINNLYFIILNEFLIRKSFGMDSLEHIIKFSPDFLCGIILFYSLKIVNIFSFDNIIISITVKVVISVIVYISMLIITKQIKVFIDILPNKLSKKLKYITE